MELVSQLSGISVVTNETLCLAFGSHIGNIFLRLSRCFSAKTNAASTQFTAVHQAIRLLLALCNEPYINKLLTGFVLHAKYRPLNYLATAHVSYYQTRSAAVFATQSQHETISTNGNLLEYYRLYEDLQHRNDYNSDNSKFFRNATVILFIQFI